MYDTFDMKTTGQTSPHRYTIVKAYLCPSYQGRVLIPSTDTSKADFQRGALTHYQGLNGALVNKGEVPVGGTSYGKLPNNGLLTHVAFRQLRDCRDGLSNTLAIGEFVQRDFNKGAYKTEPGNVRPWIMGDNSDDASYAVKVAQYAINAKVDRDSDGVLFNHLPFSSFHTGGANFALGDGSVRFLTDSINLAVYQGLATCNAQETGGVP